MTIAVRELENETVESKPQPQKKEYTFEEVAELNAAAWKNNGTSYELSEGELIPVCPSSSSQSQLLPILSATFIQFLKTNPLGTIFVDQGFIFQPKKPRTMRAPDIAFVKRERMPSGGPPKKGYWEFVPDLAIEIVSPDDKWYDLTVKLGEYFRFGVREVWVILPPNQAVIVYHSEQEARYLGMQDKLEQPEILPGFSVEIAELFESIISTG